MSANPVEVDRTPEISLEISDPIVSREVEHQPLPLHRWLVGNQQHL